MKGKRGRETGVEKNGEEMKGERKMDGGKGRSMEEVKARKKGRMEETEMGKKSKEGKGKEEILMRTLHTDPK